MSRVAVHLYYDIISPASWFGFESLTRYAQVWPSMELKLRPFLLAAIMKGSGNKPPMMVPNKGKYMMNDFKTVAKFLGIPYKMPSNFVEQAFRTKEQAELMRFIVAIDQVTSSESTEAITREMYMAVFNRNEEIGKIDFAATAERAKVPKESIEKALAIHSSDEIKNKLKANTDEALGHSAFGAPTIIAHLPKGPHMLWGSDRIEILAYLLNEKYQGALLCHNKL